MAEKRSVTIPGYEIISPIGKGGMGMVYKAKQLSLNRIVAIKILSPHLARDRVYIQRFLREARTSAKLNHENIVTGIDVGRSDNFYYFVMEYVAGETLSRRLAREKMIAEKEALNIALQIAKALSYAQAHHIIHRDIKPQNIMITTEGMAKLCDLGLAKEITGDAQITQTSMMIGTPDYLSPEQAQGELEIDIRSDIYSLGATLYHILTGEPPFTGETAMEVATKRISGSPVPVRQKNFSVSAGTASIVSKAMARKKPQRYQTPNELIEDIQKVLAGQTPVRTRKAVAVPPGGRILAERAPRKSGPIYLLIGAGLFLVLVVAAALIFSHKPPQSDVGMDTSPDSSTSVQLPKAPLSSDRRAEGELRALQVFQNTYKDQLDKIPEIRDRYDEFLAKYKGTKWENAALQELAKFNGSFETRAEHEFMKRKVAGDAFRDEGKPLKALEIYHKFPPQLQATKAYQKCQQEIELIKEFINSKFRADQKRASDLVKKHQYEEAVQVYQSIAYATPEIKAEIEELIKSTWREKKRYQENLRKQAGQEYERFCRKIEALLKHREYQAAESSCRTALQSPTLSLLSEEINQDLTIISLLKSLFQDVETAIDYCIEKGKTVKIGPSPASGRLEKSGDKIYLKIGGRRQEIIPNKLSAEDIGILLQCWEASEKIKHPNYYLRKGLFYYFEGLYPEARIELEEAQHLGSSNPIIEEYLSKINQRSPISEEEINARNLYQRAVDELKSQDWEKARQSFSELQEKYGKNAFVRAKQPEINNYLEKIKAELQKSLLTQADINRLFKGKVKLLDPATGKIEFVYRKSRNREKFNAFYQDMDKKMIAGGMLLANIWKGKMKGDVVVEFEGPVRKTSFVGIGLYYNGDRSGWYLCRVALPGTTRSPQRPRRGPLAGLLSGNAIAKINPAGESWQEKYQALNSSQINISTKPSKWGLIISLKVSRIGKKISLRQGRTVIVEAEDNSFDNGFICLVFGSQGGGSYDFLRIKGTLDLEWTKKALGKK